MSSREIDEKVRRLERMVADNSLDAVILSAQHNFAWLTAGGNNGVDMSRENGVASLAITRDGRRFIIANSIEMHRMLDEQVGDAGFEPIDFGWQAEKANPGIGFESLKQVIGYNSSIASDIPLAADVPAIESKAAACRYVLTADEIERYRALGADASAAMDRTIGRIEQGDSESEIAEKIRRELGSSGIASVVTLVAVHDRIAKYRHPAPTEKRFEKTALLVTCAKRHGLVASLSRVVSVGEPDSDLKARTEAAAFVHASLLDATRPGAHGKDLYLAAAKAYENAGFANEIDRHHQGGATGYRTRDWVAHPASVDVVNENQAFAWNPSTTGTKIEETHILTSEGIQVITASDNVPRITTVIDGREYHSPGIVQI